MKQRKETLPLNQYISQSVLWKEVISLKKNGIDWLKLASWGITALGFALGMIGDAIAEKREQEWIQEEVTFQLAEAAKELASEEEES